VKLDKYARDFKMWRDWAAIDYRAAQTLFETGDPFLWFPAATLGHYALEMYLKAALIANGLTIFDPGKLKHLDAGITLLREECAWGHELVRLAEQLAERNPAFDPSKQMNFVGVVLETGMTIKEGLSIFNPFFSELRYPQEMRQVQGLGEEHLRLLNSLVAELRHARFQWNQS